MYARWHQRWGGAGGIGRGGGGGIAEQFVILDIVVCLVRGVPELIAFVAIDHVG